MTDFSHLHALEERAVNIRERMMFIHSAKGNNAQWRSQAVQLFQTEAEIADEREFLGLEDLSTDELYAALIEEHESEVVREVTAEYKVNEAIDRDSGLRLCTLNNLLCKYPDCPKGHKEEEEDESSWRNRNL